MSGGPVGTRSHDDKHPIVKMLLIGAVVSILGIIAALAIDWMPTQATDKAAAIDRLYDVSLIVSVPIFVLVMTIAIYSVIRFRARPGDMGDGAPIHGNARLEVIWVLIPFIIVSALGAYAWIVLDEVEEQRPQAQKIRVIGQQFAFSFQYTDHGGFTRNELVLPEGRPVSFDITTKDVIHSFWIPAFRLKNDAVPGLTTRIRVTPNKKGRYDVVCAELCGLGHATMRQTARVVSQEQFNAYVARNKGKGGAAGEGASTVPPNSDTLAKAGEGGSKR